MFKLGYKWQAFVCEAAYKNWSQELDLGFNLIFYFILFLDILDRTTFLGILLVFFFPFLFRGLNMSISKQHAIRSVF